MKQDLATTILTAIVGVIVAYFVCNMIIPEIPSFTYKTLNTTLTYNLDNPNPEVFNFRAVNPTVEVYVGQCDAYDGDGNCIISTEVQVDPNQTPTTPDRQNQQSDKDSENGSTD